MDPHQQQLSEMSMKAMGMGVPVPVAHHHPLAPHDYDPLYGYPLSRPSSTGVQRQAVVDEQQQQQQQLATLTAFSASSAGAAGNSPMDYTVAGPLWGGSGEEKT